MIDYTKFLLNYFLQVELRDGTLLSIEPPFSVEFDITRNTLASSNVAQIRIYNLSQLHQAQIRKNITDFSDFRLVRLRAGYNTLLPVVFEGNITQAWSVREGVDVITQIECFDGGFAFANGVTSQSFPAGTQQNAILNHIVTYGMPNVSLGYIGSDFDSDTGLLGTTYSGNSCEIASELANGQFFIDSGKAFFMNKNECRQGQMAVINSASGLLGTPLREQTLISFDIIFEPRIVTGQKIQLQSSTDANFNGFWRVVAVKHRGMISRSVAGDTITSLRLDNSGGALNVVTTQ